MSCLYSLFMYTCLVCSNRRPPLLLEVARLAAKHGLWDVARETAHSLQDQLSPAAAATAAFGATGTTPGPPPNTAISSSSSAPTPAQQQNASNLQPPSSRAAAAPAAGTVSGGAPLAPHERTYDVTAITVDLDLLLCEIDASAIPDAYTKANVDVLILIPAFIMHILCLKEIYSYSYKEYMIILCV